jgi:hypothetical protein
MNPEDRPLPPLHIDCGPPCPPEVASDRAWAIANAIHALIKAEIAFQVALSSCDAFGEEMEVQEDLENLALTLTED